MTMEELKRAVEHNEMMIAENPDDYEAMQSLAIIAALSKRQGRDEMAKIAEELFNKIARKFMKPVQ